MHALLWLINALQLYNLFISSVLSWSALLPGCDSGTSFSQNFTIDFHPPEPISQLFPSTSPNPAPAAQELMFEQMAAFTDTRFGLNSAKTEGFFFPCFSSNCWITH